ncbi:MAG: hypothetical protein WCV68_01765 [Candidatus Paceibacterota bacterium]|jgi:hypothetical protein
MDKVETFEDLAEIAIGMLEEISKSGKPIAFVCGPISTGGLGSIEKNLAHLEKAIETAGKNGLQVFSQTPFEDTLQRLAKKYPKTDGYCLPILNIFYKKVFESGYIKIALFLPDWQSSKGATWERQLFSNLGLQIQEYPLEWLD